MSGSDSIQPKQQPVADILSDREITELYRREAPRLARYFRRRLRSKGDTSDWVQETFLRFTLAQPDRRMRNPKAYLQRIAHNLLVDGWRRINATRAHLVELDSAEPVVGPEQSYAIEANDLMRQYRQALSELTARTRVVFLLHRVEELTYNEIATRLEISINTVEYHMARALLHLDRALDRH